MQKVLGGKSPQERAAELVLGTKLKDVAVRKTALGRRQGGGEFAPDDPMIVLAKAIDPDARKLRKTLENEVE